MKGTPRVCGEDTFPWSMVFSFSSLLAARSGPVTCDPALARDIRGILWGSCSWDLACFLLREAAPGWNHVLKGLAHVIKSKIYK